MAPLLISAVVFTGSFFVPLYKDPEAYKVCYQSIQMDGDQDSQTAGRQFSECRLKYLSFRLDVQQYSGVILVLSLYGFLFHLTGGKKTPAPRKRWLIALIGFLTAFVVPSFYAPSLLYDQMNERFPWWSDTTAIPMMLIPQMWLLNLIIVTGNLLFLRQERQPQTGIFDFRLKWDSKIILVELLVVALFILDLSVHGSFIELIPMGLWFYFFASLLAYRRPQEVSL